ncbi:MAG: bifunctional diaminohydroxyphosphoribosylaminopyrimidine deaminase/5-amino-6-(5-phosphoribosylamino)uracil reductase RibD [Desulfobulbaceae bacterium]
MVTLQPQDVDFMRIALEEARKGQGRTAPNPCVGAVVVRDGQIVGRGYHHRAGTSHAEVNALHEAGDKAAGATLYVTLEPCNHTGRTPPCTQAILKAGVLRVVVGMNDPNPTVAGGGSSYLASRGVEIVIGVLEEECTAINRPFAKHITTGLPWLAMKAGMSLDGRISYGPGMGGRITGEASHLSTHRLRNTLDAILVGIGTALVDDPSLTTRLPVSESGRDPVRIILDTHLRLPSGAKLLCQQSQAPTWIFCDAEASAAAEEALTSSGAVIHRVGTGAEGLLDCRKIMTQLGKAGITSVLAEGGAGVHASLLRARLVDEVYLFVAPMFIGNQGTSLLAGDFLRAPHQFPRLHGVEVKQLGEDVLIHGLIDR